MSALTPFCMSQESVSAYHLTLLRLQNVASAFPSWQAMIDEEENLDLSSSNVSSSLPSPPEPPLLRAWMLAATARTPDPNSAANSALDDDTATSYRWTRFLAVWISLRLAGLIASPESRDMAYGTATHLELEMYEHSFLCAAWPLLPAGQRERIQSRLAQLRLSCEPRVPQSAAQGDVDGDDSCAADDDDSYEAACRVICYAALHAAQCVAREYLRITWDVLCPKEMKTVVDGRLLTLFNIPQPNLYGREPSTPPLTLAATAAVHTSCLGGLLQTLQRTQQQQHHGADPTYRVWMRMVRTALLQVGFNLVVKVRAVMIDACYALLPAMVDFEACVSLCELMEREQAITAATAAAPVAALGEAEEDDKRAQLRRTVAALERAVETFFEDTIDTVLIGYRKHCRSAATPPRLLTATAVEAPQNPLAPSPLEEAPAVPLRGRESVSPVYPGAAPAVARRRRSSSVVEPARQQLALSQAAYVLLVTVVEPTCNLLRRYAAEGHFPPRKLTGPDGVVNGAVSGLLRGRQQPHLQRTEYSAGGAAPRQSNAASAAPRAPFTVTQAFTDFLAKKLDVCFSEALKESHSSSPSATAREQAAMDSYVVAAYLFAALRH